MENFIHEYYICMISTPHFTSPASPLPLDFMMLVLQLLWHVCLCMNTACWDQSVLSMCACLGLVSCGRLSQEKAGYLSLSEAVSCSFWSGVGPCETPPSPPMLGSQLVLSMYGSYLGDNMVRIPWVQLVLYRPYLQPLALNNLPKPFPWCFLALVWRLC